jgi:hypothetical protein
MGWSFRQELRPRDVPGLVRLGNPAGDGGYVVPGWVVESTDVLLTLGMGQEWTFDEDILRMRPGLSIVGVDHTLRAASIRSSLRQARFKHSLNRLLGRAAKASRYAERIDRYRRYQRLFAPPNVHMEKAVGSVASPTTVTVDEVFARVASTLSHRVLVSMDIEGSEYEVVEDLLRHQAAINMIVTEFHDIGRHVDAFERSITEIKAFFDLVHLHGNNCAPYNHELDLPEVVELTFVHRELMPPDSPFSSDERPLPGLDVANSPGVPDYVLRI